MTLRFHARIGSLQGAPNSPFLLAFTFLCDSLPHWKSVGLCDQQKTEVVACDFQRKVIKDVIISASLPPSWMTCSWGKAL